MEDGGSDALRLRVDRQIARLEAERYVALEALTALFHWFRDQSHTSELFEVPFERTLATMIPQTGDVHVRIQAARR